ncbi:MULTISPECIES: hypothetical protein [Sphingobacterium]|uniref:Uncharacterized protein n=1 Tax=Sphingobacterium kitahiroshimense TaxID=470446 RepID=A0ABV0BYR7_9SPHI|nr:MULTISPECIES: hypothetical protein [unclassified Sphingobacterium]KKX48976.1 hypothetical protein L950_0218140 [Sphingobacterium sp. IITKGP-BTPF85]MBB2952673.1 hypothetical protein [Sphingobacterium sp. JUb56]
MKKEELKKLEAKYLAGETTLAEERLLKEQSEEGYFSVLSKQDKAEMPLDFESFLTTTEKVQSVHLPQKRKIWTLFSSIAAAVLVICLGIWYLPNQKAVEEEEVATLKIPSKEHHEKDIIETKPLVENKESEKKLSRNSTVVRIDTYNSDRSVLKPELDLASEPLASEEFYVEVNGVKITDEAEALKITENALLFASSNLKKGMKEVENIKCLSIEL